MDGDELVDGDEMRHIELSLLMRWFRPDDNPRESKRDRLHLTFIQKIELSRYFTVRRSDGAVFVQRDSGKEPRQSTPAIGTRGYRRIHCMLDGEQKKIKQHQLVLLAYFGEDLKKRAFEARASGDLEYAFVDDWYPDHLDRDGANCAVANLAPIRHRENTQRSYDENPDRKTSADQQSRPVIVTRHLASADPALVLRFPVGHEFESETEAARQTGLHQGNISQSVRKGWQSSGWYFKYGTLESDADYPGETWRPEGDWCKSLGGPGVRVSSHGRVWFKQGSIKRHGLAEPNDKYRKLKAGPETLAHRVVKRVWDGKRDKDGRWIACDVPPDKPYVLHGGEGRALWHERRDADGCERNWQADLRWGTLQDNGQDIRHEKAYLAAQAEQQ